MRWRNCGWVIGLMCLSFLGWRACAAAEEPRLVPLKYQMELGYVCLNPMAIERARRPEYEQPPESLPVLMVPEGTINLAIELPVTASDKDPTIGEPGDVNDGQYGLESNFELSPGVQWVQIDLRASCPIHAIRMLRSDQWNVYHDVIIQLSDDPAFERGVRTVFNNDHDGSSGRGKGTDRLYIESRFGKTVALAGITGRYVRFYSNGNTLDDQSHYIEAEVYGVPTDAWRQQIAADRAGWRTVKGLIERLARCPTSTVSYEGGSIVGLAGWLYCDEDFDAASRIPTLRAMSVVGYGPPPRVTSAGVGRLGDMKQLTRLEVEGNRPLLEPLLEQLPALQSLEELNLNSSARPDDLPHIIGLKKLRKLGLWLCRMRDDDLAKLAAFAGLEELCLAANPIADAGLQHLRTLTKLKRLDLRFTHCTPAGLDELRKAMPGLQIEYDEPGSLTRPWGRQAARAGPVKR